jgi:hypothetical protein
VVLLRLSCLVVDLLSRQKENSLTVKVTVSIHPIDPDIVVRDDDKIETCLDSGEGDVLMAAMPIRITCVCMQVADVFVCHNYP